MMAYFGWPIAHEDDAERSVMQPWRSCTRLESGSRGSALAVRIGVATGTVVVGALFAEQTTPRRSSPWARHQTWRHGCRVWLGSDEVVIAPSTRRLVGALQLSDMGAHSLKGIEQRCERASARRAPSLGTLPGGPRRVALTPLVGREQEIGLLQSAGRSRKTAKAR